MAVKLDSSGEKSLENINAIAEIERARSCQNERTVKDIGQKFLGRIYDRQTNQVEEIAVESFKDCDIVLDHSESLYIATLDAITDSALDRLNRSFGFNIAATIGSAPVKVQGGLDISHSHVKSSDSATMFCAVACMRKDHVGLQKMPKRLGVETESLHSAIIKSMTVYAGYRVLLEIIFRNNKSEEKMDVGVKAEGSTLSAVLGGSVEFTHENSSLADRNIAQINIKEIRAIGGYRVPKMEIPSGNNFPKIQEMFENIREHFETHYYSVVDRLPLIQRNDLVPLRESSSSRSIESIEALSEAQLLPPPKAQRNADYYQLLALESTNGCESFSYQIGSKYYALDLGRMLDAMEMAFSNLLKSPNEKTSFLFVGTDPLITRMQVVQFIGGEVHKGKALYPKHPPEGDAKFQTPGKPLPSIFPLDDFKGASWMPSVYVYNDVLETPILTSKSMFPEFDICLGIATSCAISLSTPSKIVFCIPRNFFTFSRPTDLVKKMNHLYESLRRIFYNPTSCKSSLLFSIDDQQEGLTDPLKKEIVSAFEALKKELNKQKGGAFAWPSSSSERKLEEIETEEALHAYAFIVNRLTISSNLQGIFSSKEKDPQFCPTFEVTENPWEIKKAVSNKKLKSISLNKFDRSNMSLNNYSAFENVLKSFLYYFSNMENEIANLEIRSTTNFKILSSYNKILNLLLKKEVEKLENEEAEKVLGEAITKEIGEWVAKRTEKQGAIQEIDDSIKFNQDAIEQLKKDTTPTPLKLQPDTPITMRPFWRIPPFGKEYIFQTNYNFSKCEFTKTPGSFNCLTAEFMNTKKTIFTPKHWEHEKDLRAKVQIWIEKREHPQTAKEITNYNREIQTLDENKKTFEKELQDINDTIDAITTRNIKKLEFKLAQKKSEYSAVQSILNEKRSEFSKHCEYYEILQKIEGYLKKIGFEGYWEKIKIESFSEEEDFFEEDSPCVIS